MVHDPENPFGELDDLSGVEKAQPAPSSGRIPPGTYQAVCTSVDLEGDGKLVDHHYFETPNHTKAVKLFWEILSPEKVGEEETKGRIHEFVFWCTEKNRPYVMRDAETILGAPITKLSDLLKVSWAGKTLEFGVKDEPYQGFMQSKVTFINPWSPDGAKKKESQKETEKLPVKGQAGQPAKKTGQPQTTGAKKQAADF